MKRHLALVGFMAAGKSTIGKRLARKLKCSFVDLDDAVAERHGEIETIFYEEGEAAFREYEREALERVLDAPPGVIALGGGAVTHEPTAKLLKKHAYRVFIKVSAEQVLARVRAGKSVRPLLGPTPSLQKIKELYAKRMPSYAHSDYVVEADELTAAQTADAIAAWAHKKKIALA